MQNQSFWDWTILISGVIYVFFAAKNNPVCWIWGIISCGILSVMTVMKYNLYADGALNAFYVVMGFIGLYKWKYSKSNQELPITRIGKAEAMVYIGVGVCCTMLVSHFLSEYTQAAASGLDSLTTVFSIIATIWLVKRYVENWMLWIVVDLLYVNLYFSQGAMLYLLLMLIYTAIAMKGFIEWNKQVGEGFNAAISSE